MRRQETRLIVNSLPLEALPRCEELAVVGPPTTKVTFIPPGPRVVRVVHPDFAEPLLRHAHAHQEIWFALQSTAAFHAFRDAKSTRWCVDVSRGSHHTLLSHALARWVLDHPGLHVRIYTHADDPLVYTLRNALAGRRACVVSHVDFSLDDSFADAEEHIDPVSREATFRVKGSTIVVAPPGARCVAWVSNACVL